MDGLAFGFVTQQYKNIASFQNGIPMGDELLVVPFDRNQQCPAGPRNFLDGFAAHWRPKTDGRLDQKLFATGWRSGALLFHEPFQEHVIDRLRVQQICNGVGGQGDQ